MEYLEGETLAQRLLRGPLPAPLLLLYATQIAGFPFGDIIPPPTMALTSGTKLGPYEIQAPLGAGGMGEVYRAHDTRLERTVAIKILPSNHSSNPSLRQRLEREAKAISKLSHPHICTLHDIGHQDGVDFLVMEYLEGETLEQRLIKGALPMEQALRCAAQIADALAKA